MNSKESTYYRPDRDTRREDYYDDRWEERQGSNHDAPRDNFPWYDGDSGEVPSSMERSGGDGEHGDTPRRQVFIEKSLNSNQTRRSPLKRHSDSRGSISPVKYVVREHPRFKELDEEFVRKQRQLQMIEEEIARKKSAIKFLSSETERCLSEKKRRRFTEDVGDFKYGQSPDDSEYRQSSNHMYRENDFPGRQPPRDILSYRKTSRDSSHRKQPEDFTYNQASDGPTYRKSPAHYKERHFQDSSSDEETQSTQFFPRVDAIPRERDHSPSSDYGDHRKNSLRHERNASYEKIDAIPRERHLSPSSDYEDHRRNRLRYERNKSYEQACEDELDVNGEGHALGERPHNAAEKGFERFLGLLNKGVNVDKLIKIVSQSTVAADGPTCPQSPPLNAEQPSWSDRTTSRQERHPDKLVWSESRGSLSDIPQKGNGGSQPSRQNSPYRGSQKCSQTDESGGITSRQERHPDKLAWGESRRSLSDVSQKGNGSSQLHRQNSPYRSFETDEISLNKSDMEANLDGSRAMSPRLVEKILVRPVDEQKSRQMQDLLQVIGMDLGCEELGQMSSRIQERLYGKKDDFEKSDSDLRREKDRRVSSRRYSRSLSSSRSSYGPQKESLDIQKDVKEAKPSYSVSQPPPTPVMPAFDKSKPPPTLVMPVYNDMSKPPPMPAYPPPPFFPYTYSTATPAMPPTWGIRFGMMPPVPFVPGYPPCPSVSTLNTGYQAASTQASSQVTTSYKPIQNRQLIDLSCPTKTNQNPVQNTVQLRSKTWKTPASSRHRFLQNIETKTD